MTRWERFRTRKRVREFGGSVLLLAHACERIGQEFTEISRAQRDEGKTVYDTLIYVYPIQVRDRERVMEAYTKAAMVKYDTPGIPAAVPFRNGAFMLRCITPSADHAAMMALTITRQALHDCGIKAERVQIEAEEGDPDEPFFLPAPRLISQDEFRGVR